MKLRSAFIASMALATLPLLGACETTKHTGHFNPNESWEEFEKRCPVADRVKGQGIAPIGGASSTVCKGDAGA